MAVPIWTSTTTFYPISMFAVVVSFILMVQTIEAHPLELQGSELTMGSRIAEGFFGIVYKATLRVCW
jgi:hypothetical protein